MTTTIVKKTKKTAHHKNGKPYKTNAAAISPIATEGVLKNVAVSEIDFSPLNYRKFYSEAALADFATEIAVHGIISPLTLRELPEGRHELVAGERRLRAAQLAGLTEVPAVIKVLTDAEVTEIQLAENLQRENPHPMNEAQAIGLMLQVHKTIDEIAARLGKSRTFVYSRTRLLNLIEPIQEMFFADALTIQEAFDIAALATEAQEDFFVQYCSDWKEQTGFRVTNLRYALSRFKYDLKNAPFDTTDKKLVPGMGACTNCPFNSATLKSLFPELAEQATCTKPGCYQAKCNRHFVGLITDALDGEQPDALLFDWGVPEPLKQLLNGLEGIKELPRFGRNEVALFKAPVEPDKKDYHIPFDDDEEEQEDETAIQFDEDGYQDALLEYRAELEEYHRHVQDGDLKKGLLILTDAAELVLFSERTHEEDNRQTVTAKEVQEAIKSGEATPELLEAEITRLNEREKRARELDREKNQLTIHTAFTEAISDPQNVTDLTDADRVAARLLVYQSLDWSMKRNVDNVLFAEGTVNENGERLTLYEQLQNLTEQQYSYLIRAALVGKSDSKLPNTPTGEMTRRVAESAGIDINGIEQQQQAKADDRKEKLDARVMELQKKISRLTALAE
ncbi:ParB/RepB/Spo0J family partition protein [Mucilaginibacter paludis]|uniref:ParB-like partition protein n=1 Tax=Mucilaginibacter paludis DSM 18603 TaxID=714943 RepID=H1YDT4_9SPHI|nr:ParB/RepB/Spo0J family partition protein [Mucilaginibacter paludis]EHQ24274.1 parB-like partition protein [Mucilaginibacter paludis DSM 18603]